MREKGELKCEKEEQLILTFFPHFAISLLHFS